MNATESILSVLKRVSYGIMIPQCKYLSKTKADATIKES